MAEIIRMKIILRDHPLRDNIRNERVDRSFDAYCRQIVMLRDFRMLRLRAEPVVVTDVMNEHDSRACFQDLPDEPFIGFAEKGRVPVIHAELDEDQIRMITEKIRLHSRAAELRRRPADAGIDISQIC